MARRRRSFDIFSMSFLDTICCAFGAVILLYMIINASAGRDFQDATQDQRAEVDLLEEKVLEGYQNLVVLRNALEKTDEEIPPEGLEARILEETEKLKQQLADADKDTLSKRESIERLKQDLKSLEESNRRLEGGTKSEGEPGTRIKGFKGTGDRQYLTGLRLGGSHILVLVDASASMLDETVVNVIRLRNMSEAKRLSADKWRRTVRTVDWITSQLPQKSQFQIYAFNTQATPLIASSAGKWLSTTDPGSLNDAITQMRNLVPSDGTSLENAFSIITQLNPRPDSIVLVTDGLPTQGASPPALRKTVDGEQRLKLFERSLGKLPSGIPVNVILMPMEGDPMAPSAFWALTRKTKGIFLSPARDWP
jgi:hypothetical protein